MSVAEVSSALSPKTWPFSLEWLPRSACLVGGTVRDALLGRESEYLDLDFVLPKGAVETAQAIARHHRAGYVLLDADRQIARVVFEQGTADFAQQVGSTLEADLGRRDFTVNAIAYNPHTDQLIDPLQGYADLQKHQLRMVSAENLEEDPLRLLRAYRQAAQLGFLIDQKTRFVIYQLAPLLQGIAAERIQSELNYLLSTPKGTPWLTAAWRDGLLQDWFPDAGGSSLELIAAIDQTTIRLKEILPDFIPELLNRIRNVGRMSHSPLGNSPDSPRYSQNSADSKAMGSVRTWLSIAKLTNLLSADPPQAEAQLRRLKYSRNEIQAVSTILKFLPQICPAGNSSPKCPSLQPESVCEALVLSLRQQYEFFQSVGATFPAVVVLAIAAGTPMEAMIPLVQRFLNPDDPVAHPIPLLSGQDLMAGLNLSPGPRIGQLLAAIQLARAEGKIVTAEEAMAWAGELVKE
ncbi:CCA tRNA nucleotidyltransferase [Kovacikia minuta CCNUW1]|nr:CCA tRNA nucleotidyltransferase [Kovacikia minuta CCNUW1]